MPFPIQAPLAAADFRSRIIDHYPPSDDMPGKLVKLQLNRIKKRVEAIPFETEDDWQQLPPGLTP